ncbi:MAG: biotin--[acetyl-CoA-carboxylase] ligase [Bacteroidales bacterium]|nr:biotin--[acetyl-CoA-carboxylase] ligase [Bacteroidales bacterium]
MEKTANNQYKETPVINLDKVKSTNDYAWQLIRDSDPPEGTIVSTHEQTAGKGYGANQWESQAGMNITLSLVLYPYFLEADRQFYLNKIISLAIVDVLKDYLPAEEISIKWPNDIYAGNLKIAGILTKNVITGFYLSQTVAGIGLNVNQETFYSGAPNPVSMKNLTNKNINLKRLLTKLKDSLLARYRQAKEGHFKVIDRDYWDNLFRKTGYHTFLQDNREFEARIADINHMGQLILEKRDGSVIAANFKEVEFVL